MSNRLLRFPVFLLFLHPLAQFLNDLPRVLKLLFQHILFGIFGSEEPHPVLISHESEELLTQFTDVPPQLSERRSDLCKSGRTPDELLKLLTRFRGSQT